MNSLKIKFAIILLVVGLLAACGSQPTQAPASQPTDTAVSGTEAPLAADTSAADSSPTAEAAPAGASVSFATDILPMLESRCVSCHGGDRTEKGLSLKSYSDAMAGSERGAVITPGDADNSVLADMVISQKMPKRGPKLTPSQIQLIVDWINQGALDN
jgi:mono/diheme cytochrome c family protein